MDISFLTVLIAVVALIVIAVPGYVIVKTKLVPANAVGVFSTLVLYVCAPAQVFMAFQKESYSAEIGINMLIVAGLATVGHLIIIGISYLIVRGKSVNAKKRVVRLGSVFGNAAYMGLPFLQILFEGKAPLSAYPHIIVYAAVFISVFNVLNWTFGVFMITGNKKDISVKKVLFHPIIIAVILGFVVFVAVGKPLGTLCAEGTTGASAVSALLNSVKLIGDMVTPMAMFVIGMRLANVNLKQIFLDKWAYVVCFMKLIVMALITIFMVAFLPIHIEVKYAMFFLMSMPCATSCSLLTVLYDGDSDFASVCVLLSTVLSILTIPLMFLLFGCFVS